MEQRLRVGILGAARNVPFSVLEPIRNNADLAAKIDIMGISSLEQKEAETAAKGWGIMKAYKSFEELLQDSSIDAVYNVLPREVRAAWTIRALMAGKHVLSETPLGVNAKEALMAQRAAEDCGRVLLEGTHPKCHPVTKRVREMIMHGKVGSLEHIDLNLPVGHGLDGKMVCSRAGALMSLGCHGVAIVRALAGEEPKVISATAQPSKENPEVDLTMSCNLRFPSGGAAHIGCSVAPDSKEAPSVFTITGSGGCIRVKEWFTGKGKSSNEIALVQFDESGERFVERIDNPQVRDTFYFMLMTFISEIREQERRQEVGLPWAYGQSKGPGDAVMSIALIDAIYKAAGMKPRPSASPLPEPYNHIGMAKL
mmetsp:Transcript_130057/g.364042  ORF Transcript_130057/g.364042 Transcript_130057/m.364042 type:complete len:368 (-) Transcript_130057:135-1238(-)